MTRAILFHKHVPRAYWGEAVLTSTYLINRLPTHVLELKSPIESLNQFFPNVKITNHLILRIFGYVCFVHIHSSNRGKLDPRAQKCIFIGYSCTQKGYKCYHPPTRKYLPLILDPKLTSQPTQSTTPTNRPTPQSTVKPLIPNQEESINQDDPWFGKVYSRRKNLAPRPMHIHDSDPNPRREVTTLEIESNNNLNLPIAIRKGSRECTKRPLYPLSNYVSFHKFSPAHKNFLMSLNSITIPKNVSEALSDENWKQAMNVEMKALEQNRTWRWSAYIKEKRQ